MVSIMVRTSQYRDAKRYKFKKKKTLHIYFLNQINRHHKLNLITERKKQENIQGKEDKHKRRTKNGSGIEGRTIGPSKSLLTREMLGHTSKIISNFTFANL